MKKGNRKKSWKSGVALLLVVFMLIPTAEPLIEMLHDLWENAQVWVDFDRPDSLDDTEIVDNTGTNTEEVDDGSNAPLDDEEERTPQNYYPEADDKAELAAMGLEDAVLVSYDTSSRTYKTGKDNYVTIIGGATTTYVDESRKLQLIDNTLVESQLQSRSRETALGWKNNANEYTVLFPYAMTADTGITLVKGDVQLEMIPLEGNYQNPTVKDNAIRYNNVYNGIDVQYTVIGDSVKEDIILNQPIDKTAFQYVLKTTGLKAELRGTLLFFYPEGDSVENYTLVLYAPMMEDAAGEICTDIELFLEEENGQTILTVIPNAEWLNDESRQYPVRIDPSVVSEDSDEQIFNMYGVEENFPGYSFYGDDAYYYVGLDDGSKSGNSRPNGNCRLYVRLNSALDSIPTDANITSATLSISQRTNYSKGDSQFTISYVNGSWKGDITWNTQPKEHVYLGVQNAAGAKNIYINYDISEAVNNWLKGVWEYKTLVIKGLNEGSSLEVAEVCEVINNFARTMPPKLIIEWEEAGDPFLSDYPLDNTIIQLHPLVENSLSGVQMFDALFVSGLANANATVTYKLYKNGTTLVGSGTTTAEKECIYPDSTVFEEYFPQAHPQVGSYSNWQSSIMSGLQFDTIYQVKAFATKTVDGVEQTGAEAVSDSFLLYLVKDYDTLPKIAQHYGVSLDTLMKDNKVQDTLVVAGNVLFIRNPKTAEPYNTAELSDDDKRKIDGALMGRGLHCEFGFEPINLNTGNFYMGQSDAAIADFGGEFTIGRTYNSLSADVNSVFGRGWSFAYDQYLSKRADGTIIYKRADGSYLYFTQNDDGSYSAPAGYIYELVEEDGWKITDASQKTYAFDQYGMLTSVTDAYGFETKLTYDESYRLSSIEIPSGKVFRITQNDSGYITKITLPDNHYISYEYDENGNLVAVTNANGATRTYQYDSKHQMTSWVDENGNTVIVNVYDAEGRVVKQTDANGGVATLIYGENTTTTIDNEGNKTVYTYDENHRTTSIVYADGSYCYKTYNGNNELESETTANGTRKYTYDKFGNIATETREDGTKAVYTYNDENKLISVIGYEGGTVNYAYNSAGDMVIYTQADGTKAIYTYDNMHRMLTQTDGKGVTITYTYDGPNLVSYTDGYGNLWSFVYDDMNRLTSSTDPLGNTISYTYDANGNKTSETAADGGRTTYQLDALGNVLTQTDPLGNTTTYTYDKMYNRIKETDALGNSTWYQYDKNGKLIQTTDALENSITYVRDCMGRVVKEVSEANGTRIYEYDLAGNLVRLTDGEGNITVSEYNTLGLVTKITDAQSNITQYYYDALGNKTKIIYADGTVKEYVYDSCRRLIKEVNELGVTIQYTYDANNNMLSMSDDSGRSYTYEYDKNNNKIREVNPEGGVATYAYDAVGRQISYTDEEGRTEYYEYDAVGRLISTTDALGNKTTNTYDMNGNLKVVMDAEGNITQYTYDPLGHMTSITDALGNITVMHYNALGLLCQTTDSLKGITTYEYDAAGNVTKVVDALGNEYFYTYDKNGNNTSVTEPQNTKAYMEYDSIGQLVYVEDGQGLKITYEYNSIGQLIAQKDNAGNEVFYTYDSIGNVLTETDQLGRVTSYTYDRNGLLIQVVEPNGSTTSYEYDVMDRVVAVTDAEGTRTTFTYDKVGNQTAITEADGATYTYEYDALNRVVAIIDPLGNVRQYVYDAFGKVLSFIDTNGTTVTYTYDANGNVITITDGNGGTTTYEYDELDRLIAETSPEGEKSEYRYDALDNLIKYKDATGAITQYRYDSFGNMVETISPKGKITEYTFDKHGNVLTTTDPSGNVTTYTYNLNDQLTSMVQPNGGVYSYVYDEAGRLESVTSPLGFTTNFTYDVADNVIKEENSLGQTAEYTYDRLHRMTSSVNAVGGVTAFAYDVRSNLISETNALGYTNTYAYDVLGRLIEEKNPLGETTEYAYDPVGNLQSVLTPGGAQIRYSYDGSYNVTAVEDPLGNITSYAYDKSNRLTGTTDALGQMVTYAYDEVGRVTSETDKAGNTMGYTYDLHGNVITVTSRMGLNTHYRYDDNDNLIEVEDSAGNTTTYSYDSMGWLTSYVSVLGKETTYTYDLEGNQTSRTDATGRTESYEYDEAGRLITYTSAGGKVTHYDYNELNQLIEKSYMNDSGEASEEGVLYGYDALGQRISMADAIGNATYGYDALGRISTATDSAGQTVTYTYDVEGNLSTIGYPDGTVVTYGYDLNGNLTSVTDMNGDITYYKYDALNRMVETIRPNYLTTYVTYDALDHITKLETKNIITGRLVSSYSYTYNEDGYVTSEVVEEAIVSELFETLFEEFLDDLFEDGNWESSIGLQKLWGYFYEALHMFCDHTDADGDGKPDNCRWANLTVTTEYNYYYDENWQLTRCTEIGEYIGTTTYEYWYDEDGNRTRYVKTYENETLEAYVYTYNDSNQLVSRAKQSFWGEDITYHTYDEDGNMISEKTGLWETTYEYTAENRLSVVRQQGVVLMAALYDGDGNRLFTMDYTGICTQPEGQAACEHKECVFHDEDYREDCFGDSSIWIPESGTDTEDTETTSAEEAMRELAALVSKKAKKDYTITEYVNDITVSNEEVLAELDAKGDVKAAYTYGLDRISCTTAELGIGVADADIFYYLYDAQGSVSRIASEWGRVLENYAYDPYGNLTYGFPDSVNFYGYNGESTNLFTGLQYLRARYYDMSNGSFLSEDTYAGSQTNPLSLNRYTYVNNNPVNYSDPSGHVKQLTHAMLRDGDNSGSQTSSTVSKGQSSEESTSSLKTSAGAAAAISGQESGLTNKAGASASIGGKTANAPKFEDDDKVAAEDASLWDTITGIVEDIGKEVESTWNAACEFFEENKVAINIGVGLAVILFTGIITIVTEGAALQYFLGALIGGILSGAVHAFSNHLEGEDVLVGFAEGFSMGAIMGAISPAMSSSVQSVTATSSILSNVFVQMGLEGLLETGAEELILSLQGTEITPLMFFGDWAVNSFTSGFNPQMKKLTEWFDDFLKKAEDAISNAWKSVSDFALNVMDDPKGFLKGLGIDISDVKQTDEVLEGILEGGSTSNISSKFDDLLNSDYYRYDPGYDCAEIAEDFYDAASGQGNIYRIEGKNGSINGFEYDDILEFDYHEVYSDGTYIYDPRYQNIPILKDDYFKALREINPDGFDVFTIK